MISAEARPSTMSSDGDFTDDQGVLAQLDALIDSHSPTGTDPFLIEARRLRHILGRWRALPPTRETRAAMISRVDELIKEAQRLTSMPSLPVPRNKGT